jgi:hypothetical protein
VIPPCQRAIRLELDACSELSPAVTNRYQSARGVLRWAVKLERIDLTTKTHLLAAHMAMPNEGHLITVIRVFLYLKKYHNARIACDPTFTEIDFSKVRAQGLETVLQQSEKTDAT